MSKNRTLQAKRWKMENKAKRYALGDHARKSENPLSSPGTDDRDGRLQPYDLIRPQSKAQLRAMLDCDLTMHVTVKKIPPRKTKGLDRDYGNRGKGGNHAWQKTFGDGQRILQGISYANFADWKI